MSNMTIRRLRASMASVSGVLPISSIALGSASCFVSNLTTMDIRSKRSSSVAPVSSFLETQNYSTLLVIWCKAVQPFASSALAFAPESSSASIASTENSFAADRRGVCKEKAKDIQTLSFNSQAQNRNAIVHSCFFIRQVGMWFRTVLDLS